MRGEALGFRGLGLEVAVGAFGIKVFYDKYCSVCFRRIAFRATVCRCFCYW